LQSVSLRRKRFLVDEFQIAFNILYLSTLMGRLYNSYRKRLEEICLLEEID